MKRTLLAWVTVWLLALACLPGAAAAKTPAVKPISLGPSVMTLNGPWRFSTGDDSSWSDPALNDSKWETVDLTAPPGSHDGDVGFKNYAPGWGARGHKGYAGVAWYRVKVTVAADPKTPLAIAGPAVVDGSYQLFVDGEAVGGSGDFSAGRPATHSNQPRLFQIAPAIAPAAKPSKRRTINIALRVWTPPEFAVGAGGGVRVAPVLGRLDSVREIVRDQWMQVFEGYIVDAVLAFGLLVLAAMAAGLMLARPEDPAYRWMAIALALTALMRDNQCLYAWTQAESLATYGIVRYVLLTPLALGAWVQAWRFWLGGKKAPVDLAVAGVTGLLMAASLGGLPWFGTDGSTHGAFHLAETVLRIFLAALYVLAVATGVWRARNLASAFAAGVAAIAAVGLFADELTQLGVKGIWFPYGVGVSRTQYAYAVLIPAMFALILQRFVALTREAPAAAPPVDLWGAPPKHDPDAAPKRFRRRQAGQNPDARPAT